MNNIMNHDKNPAMVVKDLCLWYSSTQALKDVNIEIEGQSITALIGPSGCGKSTFLKSLNRMMTLSLVYGLQEKCIIGAIIFLMQMSMSMSFAAVLAWFFKSRILFL